MPPFVYSVAPEVFAQFPGYVRGVLRVDGCRNSTGDAAIAGLLRSAEQAVRESTSGNVSDLPEVAAWRAAFRQFGAKPSEHRSSLEALLRRVTRPDALPSINALVDIGNVVTLRHRLPVGVHPWPVGVDALALRAARSDDRFVPSLDAPPETPPPGEIVFAAGSTVLTRRWTWRQASSTRIEVETSRVFVNVDGLPPTGQSAVRQALDDVRDLVTRHCGGAVVGVMMLSVDRPAGEFAG